MASIGSLSSPLFPSQFHANGPASHCNPNSIRSGKTLDFHSGQRFVEISAMKGKDWGLKWSTLMQLVCGMRDKGQNRGPLWKGRVLSNESIQAVQALRRAKGDEKKLEKVVQTRISRLLKKDLMAVLKELQRQDQCDLALLVFEAVRKEMWYKPNLSLYADMILLLGRNKLLEKVEALLVELEREGLQPDTRVCTELLGAFIEVGMVQNAMETYELMKQSECEPDASTFTILIKGLERLGEPAIAAAVRKEVEQYLVGSSEFLEALAGEVVTS